MESYRVEKFDRRRHRRDQFVCDEPELTTYLRSQMNQDVRRNVASCYVLLPIDRDEIVGFYTLSATSLTFDELPGEMTRRLPRYEAIPAALIGRLAVHSDFTGQQLGKSLLVDAIERAVMSPLGVFVIVVDAKNERAAAFYQHFGFTPVVDSENRLVLPVSSPLQKRLERD